MKKFSKESYLLLHDNPKFISGIHNYCDRWCERCPKTMFCSVFATEQAFNDMNKDEPNREDNTFAFMENMFEITHELIIEMAAKHGIDLDTIEDSATIEIADTFETARNHPLSKKGEAYFMAAHNMLKTNNDYFRDETESQMLIFGESHVSGLNDAFEIIRWYSTMIPAKLVRAIGTLKDNDPDEEWSHKELYGTLKVALISIQRSMIAWAKVLEYFSELEDAILPLLVMLEKMYKTIVNDYPLALTYKRAGLDD